MKQVPKPSTNRSPRAAKPAPNANGAPAPTCAEIEVPLRPETIRRLEAISQLTGKSVNDLICASVAKLLPDVETPPNATNGSHPSQRPLDLDNAMSAACWLIHALTEMACAPDDGSWPADRKARLDIGLMEVSFFVEKQLVAAVADVEQRRARGT